MAVTIRKKRKRRFFKERKIVRHLTMLVGLLLAAVAHIGFFYAINEQIVNFSDAYSAVSFSQSIMPFNPVKEIKTTQPVPFVGKDMTSSQYRMIKPLDAVMDTADSTDAVSQRNIPLKVVSPVVIFSGTAAFPNSQVLLEVHSDPFFTSVNSDANGKWTWSNYGNPLDAGMHTITAYNVSPYELSGKRDIFAGKYSFVVTNAKNDSNMVQEMDLKNEPAMTVSGGNGISDYFLKNNAHGIYLFDVILLDKKEYIPSDIIDVQITFSDMGSGSPQQAEITYDIFPVNDSAHLGENVISARDTVTLDGDNAFLKQIVLKDRLVKGGYILKISADIAGKKYVQNIRFSIADKEMVHIGNVVLTREKLNNVIVWNILLFLIVAIIILIIIIFEYRRFIFIRPVDENMLKKRGYFT